MFDSVRNNKKIVQLFLVLITIPFALWGVESYISQRSNGEEIATVGKVKITQQELNAALNEQKERLSAQMGASFDASAFDTTQARQQVLDGLVTKKLLALEVNQSKLSVSKNELVNTIASIPAFQENGQFLASQYEAALSSQGIRPEFFEARVRQDLMVQQLTLPVSSARLLSAVSTARWLSVKLEQREIDEVQLPYVNYHSQVNLSPDAAQKYYVENGKLFELPEQVRAEFVVLNADALAAKIDIGEPAIKARYEADSSRYTESESRRASHILIALTKDAEEPAVKLAQQKAQSILNQLNQNKSSFDVLAKQNSQDLQSAEKGGDLGWFSRGLMTKAFEDAVFSAKENGPPVLARTEFGFHVIRVTGVKAQRVKLFDEVKAAIAAELKRDLGAKQYAEAVESFGNMVYEQSDSLSPVMAKWKINSEKTGWLKKTDKLAFPFDNKKLLNALFNADTIKKNHNTEAVEVLPGVLVAARVLEYKQASRQDFSSVKATIENQLIQSAAERLAVKDGEEKLLLLTKDGGASLSWSIPKTLSRTSIDVVPPNALNAIFKAKVNKLPAFVGVANRADYSIYRINAVKAANAGTDSPENRLMLSSYEQAVTEEEVLAWVATLKEKFPVKTKKLVLDIR